MAYDSPSFVYADAVPAGQLTNYWGHQQANQNSVRQLLAEQNRNQTHRLNEQDRMAYEYARLLNQDRQFGQQLGETQEERLTRERMGNAQLANQLKIAEMQSRNYGKYGPELYMGTNEQRLGVQAKNAESARQAAAANAEVSALSQQAAADIAKLRGVNAWGRLYRGPLNPLSDSTNELVQQRKLQLARDVAALSAKYSAAKPVPHPGAWMNNEQNPLPGHFEPEVLPEPMLPNPNGTTVVPGAGTLNPPNNGASGANGNGAGEVQGPPLPPQAGTLGSQTQSAPGNTFANAMGDAASRVLNTIGSSMSRRGGGMSPMDMVRAQDNLKARIAAGQFDYDGGKGDAQTEYDLLFQ